MRLGSFFFPVLRRRRGLEGKQKASRDRGHFFNGRKKRRLVRFRRLVKAADLSYELHGSVADLLLGDRRLEVEKRSDVPAHGEVNDRSGNAVYLVWAPALSEKRTAAQMKLSLIPWG